MDDIKIWSNEKISPMLKLTYLEWLIQLENGIEFIK